MAFFSKTKIVTLAPLRNENAFQSFFDELHRLAASTRKNLVLDLSSLSENPGLDFGFMIEDAWLSLTERGLGMAVVVNEGLVKTFRDYTFARSPIACSVSEAEKLASVPPTVPVLGEHLCEQLNSIEIRFRELVNKRIGRFWEDTEPPYPPVVRLYKCGVPKGHFPFPYGAYSWSFVEADSGVILKYDDYARVADGWGCAYELTNDETRLVAEGLG